jgi:hypothetical protein
MTLLGPSYLTPISGTPFNQEVVASPWSEEAAAFVTNDREWWVKAVSVPEFNLGRVTVRGPLSSRAEQSVGVFRPLGRDTPVVTSGDIYGLDGTYVFLFTTEAEWEAAQNILFAYSGNVCVQDPFGDQKIVRFVSRDVDHDGTVGNPRRTVTVGYIEVT